MMKKQNYSLLIYHAILSCIRPIKQLQKVSCNKIKFPIILGKIKKKNNQKLALTNHFSHNVEFHNNSISAYRLGLLPIIIQNLHNLIISGQKEEYPHVTWKEAIKLMQKYKFNAHDLEFMKEIEEPFQIFRKIPITTMKRFNKLYEDLENINHKQLKQ